jgi:hypothetical protein
MLFLTLLVIAVVMAKLHVNALDGFSDGHM